VTSVAVRCALVTVAVLVAGWLALGYRADRLEHEGWQAFGRNGPGESLTAKLGRAESLLRRARRFNADPSPLISESLLLVYTGHRARARATAKQVVAEEPGNVEGWRLMYLLAPDRASAAHARQMVMSLDPWAAVGLR
jgi:hypothetical protein